MSIFDYTDFRTFIADYYRQQKAKNPSYSFTVFARLAEMPSRGYLKLVMDGRRNLTMKTIPKIARGLRLNQSESRYFDLIVRFTQCKSASEKNELYSQILNFPQKKKTAYVESAQHRFYSQWYYPAIREIVLHREFPIQEAKQGLWISELFNGAVSEKQAQVALEDLVQIGLLQKSPDGKYSQKEAFISVVPDETVSFALQAFQKEMLVKAAKALEAPLTTREISGVTLAIRESDISKAKQAIKDFRKKMNHEFSAISGADAVYQLNIQFFDLTEGREELSRGGDRKRSSKPVNAFQDAGQSTDINPKQKEERF